MIRTGFYLSFFLVVGACSSFRAGGSTTVAQTTTRPVQLEMTHEGKTHVVRVSTRDGDTVVAFRGIEIVLRGLTGYRGTVGIHEVSIEVDGVPVRVDRTRARVGGSSLSLRGAKAGTVLVCADRRWQS